MRRLIQLFVIVVGLGSAAGITAYANPNLFYTLITEEIDGDVLTAPQAHAAATAGDITLIDIRRPDEWAKTGSGEGAHRVDLLVPFRWAVGCDGQPLPTPRWPFGRRVD